MMTIYSKNVSVNSKIIPLPYYSLLYTSKLDNNEDYDLKIKKYIYDQMTTPIMRKIFYNNECYLSQVVLTRDP